jgi:hypothetical protein
MNVWWFAVRPEIDANFRKPEAVRRGAESRNPRYFPRYHSTVRRRPSSKSILGL